MRNLSCIEDILGIGASQHGLGKAISEPKTILLVRSSALIMLDIRELLKYNAGVRQKYFDSFMKLSWSEFIKNREASFHSIRNIFVHILGAIDYWLDFLQKEDLRIKREFDDYKTFENVRTYMEHVEKRMNDYLGSLSLDGLSKKYVITANDAKTLEVTAEDVLFHVFEEDIYHRGELNALLWQMGIDPPLPTIREYLQYIHSTND
jgi:uncharacterized damage-inducible protein DinB